MVQTRSMAARHPEAPRYFKEGLSAVFKMWTALELALFHQWGGHHGGEAAADLQEELFNMFQHPERVYKDEIAVVIEDYMEDHFNTILEDDSPDEIGALLCEMWLPLHLHALRFIVYAQKMVRLLKTGCGKMKEVMLILWYI